MNLARIYSIFLRRLYLLRRSPTRIIGIFYWSTFELLIWAVITKYLHETGGEKLSFITVILGAIILWNFFTRIQQSITTSFLEDVWSNNLANLFSSPLRLREYIAGLTFASLFNTTLAILGMTALAWLLLAYNIFQFGLLMIPFVAILFLFGITIGIATTAAILRFGPSMEVLAFSVPTLVVPFAAVFYPISALPTWLQWIPRLIPISYVFEGMRSVVQHGIFYTSSLVIAFLLAIIYFFLSLVILAWSYRSVLKQGLFTKFLMQ